MGAWDPATDSYDGIHPSVRGEFGIAKQMADTLAQKLGVGSPYGYIPSSIPAPIELGTPSHGHQPE